MMEPGEFKITGHEEVTAKDKALMELVKKVALRHTGNSSSGNYGHGGRPGERGGSAPAAGWNESNPEKVSRALKSYNPMNKSKRAIARESEEAVAGVMNSKRTKDNAPFDVITGKIAIEVKTIVTAKNDKITMHKKSLARKVDEASKEKLHPYTVVIDKRNDSLYWQKGVASFRLGDMNRAASLEEIRGHLK